MEKVLDLASWLRMKNDTVLTSIPSKSGLLNIASGVVEEESSFQEVLFRDVNEEVRLEGLLDHVEYSSSYQAVAQTDGHGVVLKMTYYIGDYVGSQNLRSSIDRKEWSAMSDIRKIAAVDKLVYFSLFAKGLVE